MTLYKNVNGVNVEMTPAEEAAFEASRIPPLPDAKAAVIVQIKAKRRERETVGASNGGRIIKADVDTIVRLKELQDASTPGQSVPVELQDGTMVMVPSAAIAGLIAAAQAIMLASAKAEADKTAEVNALADVPSVRAYDVTAGWPV